MLAAYEKEMETKRIELVAAIEQQMEQRHRPFLQRDLDAFQPLAAFCAAERKRYEPLVERSEELKESFAGLKSRLTA